MLPNPYEAPTRAMKPARAGYWHVRHQEFRWWFIEAQRAYESKSMKIIIFTALITLSISAAAGIFDPPEFIPIIHQDGSRTFVLSVTLTKHHPTGPDRSEKIAGAFLAQKNFCEKGWEITKEQEKEKRLTIEGRCK